MRGIDAVLMLTLLAPVASGADSVYMKVDGVSGEVQAKGQEGWIAVEGVMTQWERTTTGKITGTLGLEKRPRALKAIKQLDRATVALAALVREGKAVQEITFKFFHAEGAGEPAHYFTMVLKNATVTNARIHQDEKGIMREELTIDYEDLELISHPGNEKYIYKK